MRTTARETAPWIALRDCFEGVAGESRNIRLQWRGSSVRSSTCFRDGFLLVTGSWRHHEAFSDFLDMRRGKDWDHEISSENTWLSEDLFQQWRTECLTLHPDPPRGGWMSAAASAQSSVLAETDGKCSCSVAGSAIVKSRFAADRRAGGRKTPGLKCK